MPGQVTPSLGLSVAVCEVGANSRLLVSGELRSQVATCSQRPVQTRALHGSTWLLWELSMKNPQEVYSHVCMCECCVCV